MNIILFPFIWIFNNIKNDMIAELERVKNQSQEDLDNSAW